MSKYLELALTTDLFRHLTKNPFRKKHWLGDDGNQICKNANLFTGFCIQKYVMPIVLYIWVKQIIKKDGFYEDMVQCIACWSDGGRSEHELAVDCIGRAGV